MYAALNWCQEHHTEIVDLLRTLLGGIPLLMPASIDVMTDAALRDTFERWWKTPSIEALDRYKLYKLAWDIVGSEFAGRHMLYEKFYAGNSLDRAQPVGPRGALGAIPRHRGWAAGRCGVPGPSGTQVACRVTTAALVQEDMMAGANEARARYEEVGRLQGRRQEGRRARQAEASPVPSAASKMPPSRQKGEINTAQQGNRANVRQNTTRQGNRRSA